MLHLSALNSFGGGVWPVGMCSRFCAGLVGLLAVAKTAGFGMAAMA